MSFHKFFWPGLFQIFWPTSMTTLEPAVVKDVCLVTPKDILQFSNLFTMEWWGNFLLRLLFFCLVYFLHVLILWCCRQTYSGPENVKKSRPKNLSKPNKLISRKKFCIFENGQKSIFELRKSLKLPEMQFHGNII